MQTLMKVKLPVWLIAISFLLLLLGFGQKNFVYSVTGHPVISEIQIAGGVTNDEFVELYNPTEEAVNLNNWKLTKKTAGGTESDLVSTLSGTIAPHGYFLIAHSDFDGSATPDATYSGEIIAINNTVLLYNQSMIAEDKAGMGDAVDKESSAAANPSANHSIERKASSSSTSETMSGSEAQDGNGEDTDNNLNDFVSRANPDPQNTSSGAEPAILSPTPTPTLTPTETPTPTPSGTPTPTPTETPIPT